MSIDDLYHTFFFYGAQTSTRHLSDIMFMPLEFGIIITSFKVQVLYLLIVILFSKKLKSIHFLR